MAAYHCLISIWPLDPVTGERVRVNLSSADLREVTGLGGKLWAPAITEAPAFSIQLFNGDFSGPVSPGSANLPINMKALASFPQYADVDRYFWAGADVEIRIGKKGQAWPWPVAFRGKTGRPSRQGAKLALTAQVSSDDFEKDVLPVKYGGNGGIEGGEDIKGRLKPLAIGWPRNVEPVLINAVDSVYQFSGYGPIEAVTTLFERGSDFGPSSGNHANYTALVAATIAPGAWATCLAEGLIRLGAPAYGVITGDIKGHSIGASTPRLTGQIITALAGISGVNLNKLDQVSLAALDADAPYPVSLVQTQQAEFADVARSMALPCNYQAGISLPGKFFVAKVDLDQSPVVEFDTRGRRMPQVTNSIEEPVSPPYARTVFGAERSWRVHSSDEIASEFVLKGIYEETATYRYGDLVFAADGRAFSYKNVPPAAGNAPPVAPATSNGHWSLVGSATANLGRGEYTSGGTYQPGDMVLWSVADGGDGGGYVRIGDGASAGVAPSDASMWAPLVERGEIGGAGPAATSAYLTNEAHNVFAYASGVVANYNGATGDFKVFAGSTDISGSFTLSTQANPQNLTIGYSGRVYTVTAGLDANEDNASVTIRATGSGAYTGVTFDKVFSLGKLQGGYEIAATLPTTNLFDGRQVYSDEVLYIYNAADSEWVSVVRAFELEIEQARTAALEAATTTNTYDISDLVSTYGTTASAAESAAAATASQGLAETAQTAAQTALSGAQAAQTTAAESAAAATASQGLAETAQTAAQTARTNAETAFANADAAKNTAQTAAAAALADADASNTHKIASENASTTAGVSRDEAVVARNTAEGAASTATTQAGVSATQAGNAATSATNAAGSASTATTQATAAANSASTATTKATEASQSATSATTSANTASTKAGEASTSATSAATSASNALGSANTATTQATNAANSATASGNSASAANTSANVATTKATEAGQSATSAQTSANTANTKAGEASTSATSAATSATNSAGSANTASTQATLSASSANAASFALGQLFPEVINRNNFGATSNSGGHPSNFPKIPENSPLITDNGTTITMSSGNYTLALVHTFPLADNEVFEFVAEVEQLTDVSAAIWYARVLDKDHSHIGNMIFTAQLVNLTTVGQKTKIVTRISKNLTVANGSTVAAGLRAHAAFIRPKLLLNRVLSGAGTNSASSVKVYSAYVRNVTSEFNSQGHATAAATSASTASTAATNAGNSATSATTSANTASTKAGEASTSATSAATSATNAAGSANTATTQATNAANSATASGNSATAASNSASTATTKATEASQSATSATTSANTASTQAGNASTSATAAATSATNAGNSANTATTQAGVSATQAGNAATSATAAATSASTATTQATNAGNSATSATTSANNASTSAGTAGTHATNAATSAATASNQASAAQTSATLAANVGSGAMNPNAGFDNYPSETVGARPTSWSTWSGNGHYRVADGLGGFSVRIPGPATLYAGLSHYAPVGTLKPNDWVVLEADVTLNAGTLVGAGVLFEGRGAQGWLDRRTISFVSDPDQTGAVVGNGVVGRTYRFRKLVQATHADTTRFLIAAMSHWSSHGSIAAANDITWHKCMVRPATPAEIRDQTVLGPLEATVSTHAGAIADVEGRTEAYWQVVAGAGTSAAIISARADGTSSTVTMAANKVVLANLDGTNVRDALVMEDGNATLAGELRANAVTANNIQTGAIVAAKIAANAVTADKVSAGAITAAKINVTTLSAITANVGTMTAGVLQSASGAAKFDLDAARIIFNNGTFMKVTGLGFGSSSQFLEWYGPSQSNLANCTEANGSYYLKTDGTLFWAGLNPQGLTIGTGGNPTTTTYAQMGDILTVIPTTDATRITSAEGKGRTGLGPAVELFLKWQHSVNKITWSDVGSEYSVILPASALFSFYSMPEVIKTGLTIGVAAHFRIMARRITSGGSVTFSQISSLFPA